MQVAKWGNSLGIRLPVALVHKLGITEGDELVVVPAEPQAGVAVLQLSREPSKLERLRAMRRHRAPMPEGFRFDRDEANAR
ncbi:MAG: AbrB/MazE/SpoVT family DNA-binding domain-containing protein [Pseudomonadota bacterium]